MGCIGPGIILEGEDYPRLSSFTTPLMSPTGANVIAAYFLGGIAKNGVLHNYADPSKPLTMKGNPLLFSNFARCDKDNCFDTGIQFPTTAHRIIVIARPPAAGTDPVNRGLAFSDYDSEGDSPASRGGYFDVSRDGSDVTGTFLWSSSVTGEVKKTLTQPNPDEFQIFSGGWFPNVQIATSMYNMTTGENDGGAGSATSTNAYTPSGRNILIGGHYDNTGKYLGQIDVAGLMIVSWGTNLTDAMNWLYKTQGPQLRMWKR